MSVKYPALLDLRGSFVDPFLDNPGSELSRRLPVIFDVFAIDDELAVVLAYTQVVLINIRSQEVLWSITCRPSRIAALDYERSVLALVSKGMLVIWDLQNGQLLHNLTCEDDTATDMAFSPDGSLLAIATYDNGVYLWDVANGQQRNHLSNPEEDYGARQSIAFSPDGKYLASGTYEDNKVWLWNVADGQLLRMMQTHLDAERIHGLAFSPDGKLLVGGEIGGGEKVDQTPVWDVETGQLVHSFEQKTWLPVFNTDGRLLASTFIEGNKEVRYTQPTDLICLWDVADRRLLRQFKGHKERIYRLTFSPSGRTLISCGGDRVASWWDIESGQEVYRLEASMSTRASGAYSADRRFLASGLKDGTLRRWLVDAGKVAGRIGKFPGGQGQEGIAISSDGTYMASWAQVSAFSGEVCIWIKGESRPLMLGLQKWVFNAVFSSNDRLVAAGCDDQVIHIWDIIENMPERFNNKRSLPMRTFRQHSDDVRSLTFSPDDLLLASGSRDGMICLWDIEKQEAPLYILHGHTQEVTSLAFSPDGKLLASGGEDRNIMIWDVSSGRLLGVVEGHPGIVNCLAFSLDGKRLASGSKDGSIRVWNVVDGTVQAAQQQNVQTVNERAFALDGGKSVKLNDLQESIWLWAIPPSVTIYQIQQITCCL